MIKFLLLVWLAGSPQPTPVAEFYESLHCDLTARQMNEHPQNKGVAQFTCEKAIDI